MSPAGGGKGVDMSEVNTVNNFYNKSLQPNANELRKTMTKAEACLWKYVLRARSLAGRQFRRQRPILGYIVDFVCLELKLVIEVDGISHISDETIKKDLKKQNALEKNGFRVIRFNDDEVLNHIHSVRHAIESAVEELAKSSPNSLRRGTKAENQLQHG